MNSKLAPLALAIGTVLVPAAAMGLASAELYRTQAYTYGRFDARIQYAPGDGVVSAFFLWKDGSDAANAYWNELDYEKVNSDCHMQINSIYGKPKANHADNPALGFVVCAGYHDYRFEWTPTYVAWVVDGKEIRRDTGAAATAYAQNASAGMTLHFNIWPGNSSFGGNINNTPLPVHQYISWAQYSSYDNGSFTVQWREEFQSSGIPSGWAVGTWASPYSLSTHNAQNVAFVNGIAVLSLTQDSGTGNPGTPPVDPAAGGSGGAGGSAGTGAGGTTSTGGSSGGSVGTGGASSAGSGGTPSTGGHSTGGMTGAGGGTSVGGTTGSGGSPSTGGTTRSGGSSVGGMAAVGGMTATGGSIGPGGATTAGGSTASGGSIESGGLAKTGGTTATGGSPASGGSQGSGGAQESGGTTATGGAASGGSAATTTTQGGCSCSTVPAARPFVSVPVVLFLVVSRLRRKQI